MTYWRLDDAGRLHDYPPGARWRTLPPRRVPQATVNAWYAGPYREWLAAVVAAIQAEPDGARERFLARYPSPAERQGPDYGDARRTPLSSRQGANPSHRSEQRV